MPEISKQQAVQLENDIGHMRKAGMTDDDIDRYIGERLSEWGAVPTTERPTGQLGLQGTRTTAMIAGPIIGGIYGSALTAGRGALAQMTGEGIGIAAGDVAGRFVSGQPQNPKETLTTAGTGAAIGGLYRGLTQTAGAFGRVPNMNVQEAGVPTSKILPLPDLGKVTRAAPRTLRQAEQGISAESELADRVRAASTKLLNRLTPERAAKRVLIDESSNAGVRISVEPVKDALRSKLPKPEALEMSEYRLLNNKINQAIRMLDRASSGQGGTVSPTKIDEIITDILRPQVYRGTGKVSNTLFADAVSEAERAATQSLSDALPGDVRAMNEAITARLDAAEKSARLFGEDREGVINRLHSMHKPGNEDTLKAIRVLASEVNDPKLAKDAMRIATKRSFAGDIREPSQAGSGGFFGVEARTPLRVTAQAMAPFQAFAGPVAAPFAAPYGAAAYDAFVKAIQRKE